MCCPKSLCSSSAITNGTARAAAGQSPASQLPVKIFEGKFFTLNIKYYEQQCEWKSHQYLAGGGLDASMSLWINHKIQHNLFIES